MERLGSARPRDLPAVNPVLLDDARSALRRGEPSILNAEDVALQALLRLDGEDQSGLRPQSNLTGTVLHTKLGRTALAEAAIEAAVAAMLSPVALEFDLSADERSERDDHVRVDALLAVGAQLGWSLAEQTARLRRNTDPRCSCRGY